MKIIYIIIATLLSMGAYKIGGMSKESAREKIPWLPQCLVRGWFRDINCTFLTLGYYYLFMPKQAIWIYLIAIILMKFAISTYWDDKIPPKGVDKYWAHGIGLGLSTIFLGGLIPGLIRTAIMGVFMGVWCWIFSNDDAEELGRGGIIQLSLGVYLF